MAKEAVLLLAHGTPESVDQVPAYLRNVTSGRPLPEAVIEEIQHRYARIGPSPLTAITVEQALLAQAELAAHGHAAPVYVGMRNWRPYIADVVRRMRAEGVERFAALCMAPQNSRTSVGLYRRAVEAEAAGMRVDFTAGWADHPLLIEAFAERLAAALERFGAEGDWTVLFTAHSVPARTLEAAPGQAGDPYAEEARHTAALVAAEAGLSAYEFAFQSQGQSGGAWIGPTVEETLDRLAVGGVKRVLLQPIGFVCDHVEILYDVDVFFREYAAARQVRLERPESLNASLLLARAVADLAGKGLARFAAGEASN